VLAGPILRRVEPDQVTVWLALKEPQVVTLEILNVNDVLQFSGNRSTIRLGLHLHVVAVTARFDASATPAQTKLEADQNYSYNLMFSDGTQLRGSPLSAAISYAPLALPSFALPPTDRKNLRLIHGSCRKAHGPSLDSMPAIDEIISIDVTDPRKRPHQLFLTGDQIYADDVADPLLYMLRDAESALIGWRETLPGDPPGQELLPGKRTPLTRRAGLTASLHDADLEAKSHLLLFGEYTMMYLFAWSDVLWPDDADLPPFETTFPTAQGRSDSDTEYTRESYKEETAAIKDFSRDLFNVRRALANVPTYMIFDDHEITDDWFMSMEWCISVIGSPLGRRVIQNGMLAYALCQGWGNNPAAFETGPGSELLAAMDTFAGSNGSDEAARRRIANRLGLPFDQVEADRFIADLKGRRYLNHIGTEPWHNGISWHYLIAGSGYEALVLDTRTWRAYPDTRKHGYPALIGWDGFHAQILNLTTAPIGDMTVVISAAPLLSTPLGDLFQTGSIPLAHEAVWPRAIHAT
jgi:hypothetical protein